MVKTVNYGEKQSITVKTVNYGQKGGGWRTFQNTFPVVGLHARATDDPHQSMDEWPSTPVHGRKKIAWEGDKQTKSQSQPWTDIATTRPNRPSGPIWWKFMIFIK